MRVLISHSREVIRMGLVACLNKISSIESVYVCEHNGIILKKARRLIPDVILMEGDVLGENYLEIINQLRQELPEVRVVIITPFISPYMSHSKDPLSYLDAKADGYVDLNIDARQLSEALNEVFFGRSLNCPSITHALLEKEKRTGSKPEKKKAFDISKREMQVLALVAKGQSNLEISKTLFISDNTVKAHIQNILKKLNVKTRMQAVIYASQYNLLPK